MGRIGAAALCVLLSCCADNAASLDSVQNRTRIKLQQLPCEPKTGALEHTGFYRSYDDDPFKCWNVSIQDVSLQTFYMSGPYGSYRVVSLARRNASPRRLIIAIAGGPRFPTIPYNEPDLLSFAIFHLVDEQTMVYTIDHLGTGLRSLYPQSDVVPAAEEISDFIRRVTSASGLPVEGVVAASAGALVGMELIERDKRPMVLLSPPIASLAFMMTAPKGSDIPRDAASHLRYFTVIDRETGKQKLVRARDDQQIPAFAGQAYDRPLASLLDDVPKASRGCMALVYGSEDRRIIVGHIGDVVRRHPWLRIVRVGGYAHQSASVEEGKRVAGAISDALRRSRCRRAG